MSVVVDIQTVSIVIASASVVAGIVYYALQIRHQTRMRETDLILKLSSMFSDRESNKDFVLVFASEFEDYEDFVKRYGSLLDMKSKQGSELRGSFIQVLNQMETMGLLLKRKIVDADFMFEIYPGIRLWEKVKTVVEGARKDLNDPNLWGCFEYYYNEMKKREQKLQQVGVSNG